MTGAGLMTLLRDSARAMTGVRSYPAYCEHMRQHHPDAEPMTEVEFFRDRQEAHFGGGKHTSCC